MLWTGHAVSLIAEGGSLYLSNRRGALTERSFLGFSRYFELLSELDEDFEAPSTNPLQDARRVAPSFLTIRLNKLYVKSGL
jgi:hypothetical protein